ncbi:hypothetical protein C5S53_00125 [Methanophagales archaeon]|nr:hypothetical protein C5S53_00125 [Methanophagales archaeon]
MSKRYDLKVNNTEEGDDGSERGDKAIMITFFTAPKAFQGHIGIIQRNAIESWLRLRPQCEVILFGDEVGVAEVARELKVRHISKVAKNEYGTPLISSLFEKAREVGKYDVLCYVNSDIIFMSDFLKGVQRVIQWKKREPFLLVGRRWGVDIDAPWKFNHADWEKRLRAFVQKQGILFNQSYIDYFVFPRELLNDIPPFAIGRVRWDNWMIYKARSMHVSVIDGTEEIMAVHQNHNYSHFSQGEKEFWEGPEAKRNLKLAGGRWHLMDLEDVTHILTPQAIQPTPFTNHLRRFLQRMRRSPWMLPLEFPLAVSKRALKRAWNRVKELK